MKQYPHNVYHSVVLGPQTTLLYLFNDFRDKVGKKVKFEVQSKIVGSGMHPLSRRMDLRNPIVSSVIQDLLFIK